jgi:hypothetical protein
MTSSGFNTNCLSLALPNGYLDRPSGTLQYAPDVCGLALVWSADILHILSALYSAWAWTYCDAAMETSQPPAKRKRLSHACTRCRTKKIRCDELEPKCTNCVRSSVDCVTFDPRTLASVQRREAQRQPGVPSPSASHHARAASSAFGDAELSRMSPQNVLPVSIAESSPAESSPLLPVLPRFLNGNSLSVLTQWLDLAFARLGMTQRLHRTYNEIRSKEQRPKYASSAFSFDEVRDSLPTYTDTKRALLASLGQTFPIFENSARDQALASSEPVELRNLAGPSTSAEMLEVAGQVESTAGSPTPLHAIMHAISHAARGSDGDRESAERCFGYAFSQLPAILEDSQALDSLRALVLMSLYMRWRNDVEKAWQLLSLAVASVQNHGLHRDHRTSMPGSQDIFWCVFVLDKLLSVELERKPMLSSADCNRPVSSASESHGGAVFKAIVDLSKLQDEILEKLLHSRRAEEDAHELQSPTRLDGIIRDKLRLVAELDHKLLRFADNLPHGLKPTEYLYADPEALPGVTFLAVQYYQAVFLVSRNALLINMEAVQSEITRNFGGQPGSNRLKSGMHVCANAARSILSILNHAEEMGVCSPLLTPYAPLMAMYALTIHIVRRQSPATARVDLELQATAMNLIKKHNLLQQSTDRASSKDSGLLQMLERLHSFSASYIQQSSRPQPAASSTALPTENLVPAVNVEQWRPGDPSARVMSPPQSPANHNPNAHGVLHSEAARTAMYAAPMPGHAGMAVPLAFNDDWFTDMGQDAMNIDWDELAMALGLPAGQG